MEPTPDPPKGREIKTDHLKPTPALPTSFVQADLQSACMEYKDMLSDKQIPTTYS